MRVLFVGAHPDDIELGAGGTLIKHLKRNHSVLYTIFTRGERGGEPVERVRELEEVISYLGIKDYLIFDYPDTHLNQRFNELKDLIEDLVTKFRPDRIYTHSLNDAHQDHKTLAEATRVGGRRVAQILSYWSPSTYNHFSPNYFIDIKEEIREKMRVLELYRSQSSRVKREVVIGINRYHGYMNGLEYAEGFEIVRFREI
ncbi:MAG: PIG-L deacetylase family protein [Acidilobaceae archaeon]